MLSDEPTKISQLQASGSGLNAESHGVHTRFRAASGSNICLRCCLLATDSNEDLEPAGRPEQNVPGCNGSLRRCD
jgi:hypothetical protein